MGEVRHPRTPSLPAFVPVAAPPQTFKSQVSSEWVMVTPDQAAQWLNEINTNNRPIRWNWVSQLARDMAEGRWRGENGEAIRFDTNGRLVDGQHRLWACVESATAFGTLVLRNVDPEAYSTIGIGRPKNLSDFLGPVHGEKNVHNLAASIRLVYFWRHGLLAQMDNGKFNPTVSQLEIVYEQEMPGIRDSVQFVVGNNNMKRLFSGAQASLLHYTATLQGKRAEVEMFLDRLGTGLGLLDIDPVYHLRRFLLSQRKTKPGQRNVAPLYALALAIKAWNATKEGKPMRALQFRGNEEFPAL